METKTIKVNRIEKKQKKLKNIDPNLINALKNKENVKKIIQDEKIRNIIEENDLLSLRNQIKNKTKKKPSFKKKTINADTIESIIFTFKKMYDRNENSKFCQYLKKLKKYQIVPILFHINILQKKNSKAPIPLLKNILFNILTSNIIIHKN